MKRPARASRPLAALVGWSLAVTPVQAQPPVGVPPHDHVLVVVMENKSYDEVRFQPYTAGLIQQGAAFSRSYGVTHPSLPNYLALWAASTLGVTNDACPPAGAPYTVENFGHACEAAGLTWRAYSENLPAAGSDTCQAHGALYTRKHDPWTDFSNLTHANEYPFSDLSGDLSNGGLPSLAFVIPNNCNNTHDCPVEVGDAWLSQHLPAMLEGVGPRGLVILTWDEDDYAGDNHILTVFNGPLVVAGEDSSRRVTHYSVVRTICEALGLPPFGNAASDSAITGIWRSDPVLAVEPDSRPGPRLGNPYPNPGSGRFRARLSLPEPADVIATVLDVAGRRVREIARGRRMGEVALEWSGHDANGRLAPPGLYVLSVKTGSRELQRKIFRLR